MKKQILILTFFVAAILVGTSAFAQTNNHADGSGNYYTVLDAVPSCISAQSLNGCSDVDELHPIQGQLYTYTVNTTANTDDVRWFVVNNYDLSSAVPADSLINSNNDILASTDTRIDPGDGSGDFILSVTGLLTDYNIEPTSGDGTGVTSDGAATVAHSIEISWKYFSGLTTANEVILLVAVVQDDAGCTDNIIVYRIIPEPAFTLDVAVLSQSGDSVAGVGTAVYEECVSPIESAVYSPIDNTTPNGTLTVDYGENWVYFIVNGANYIDSWLPNFQISYNGGTGYAAIEADWAYAADANGTTGWNSIANFGSTTPEAIPVIAQASAASPGNIGDGVVPVADGECIVVRVRLDWGTDVEHDDAARTLVFQVDGVAYDGNGSTVADLYDDSATYGDRHYADCTIDGFGGAGYDYLEYNITPRPEVENAITAPVDHETKTGEEN